MGYHPNISIDKFPKQNSHAASRVAVCFDYDTSRQIEGKIIRDDIEEPFYTVIQLDDGRVILATECQYTPLWGETK